MKKACIVGWGAIGPIHANSLDLTENAEFYAVCDINPERLEACSEEYEGIKTFESFDEMLLCEEIDSVHICTPHYLHFDMIKKALAAGKNVVAEKPVTMTREEFNSLAALDGADKVCLILQNRFNPCAEKVSSIIASGEYGKVTAVKGILTWKRDAAYYNMDEWRGQLATEGGGVLINQAVHTLDLLLLWGGKCKAVKAQMNNFSLRGVIEVEDTMSAYMELENDVRGIFFATNAYTASNGAELEIILERTQLRYMDGKLYCDGELICKDDFTKYKGKKCWGAGHALLIDEFYTNGNYISLSDAKNMMETMFAMYESAKNSSAEIII